ncbi:hypothetical protein PACILC2_50170 [Paenibacillus cisolokensis]|uniref:ParB-like N-terminal domain-containing protein n=1 Tax=Paenibacillus cisolokensis TaxID=1658519 RepID=A0ABQ4NE01_9BACL|nr:ParB N-terminal domain-containing protein [Paenibacillus cisolokensis]GIQ66449.1 hypothetical protein PACILC2_50170 [Paenibacillus cisolokensis]
MAAKDDMRASIKLTTVADLFSTEESRADQQREKVMEIPLSEISDFPGHPFKVKADEAMLEMADSVKQYGVLVPGLVRPKADGGYEMVAGHRRKKQANWQAEKRCPVSSANWTTIRRRSLWWTAICNGKIFRQARKHLPIR